MAFTTSITYTVNHVSVEVIWHGDDFDKLIDNPNISELVVQRVVDAAIDRPATYHEIAQEILQETGAWIVRIEHAGWKFGAHQNDQYDDTKAQKLAEDLYRHFEKALKASIRGTS